jgi:HEAT repeat protein
LLLATLLAPLQDDPKALVEKLRAERPEDREDARRKLKALGAAVLPELERLAKSPDAEAAAQARLLIRVIDLMRLLSPRLLKEFPGIEEKLATGGDEVWTETLLTAADRNSGRLILFKSAELLPLADRAARGAKTTDQKLAICEVSRGYSLRSAAPTIRGFLASSDPHLRGTAAEALGVLRHQEAIPDILKLIDDDFDERYFDALFTLEAKAELIALLQHREPAVRATAVTHLSGWPDTKPHILKMLKDPVLSVRGKAAGAAGRVGAKEAIPLIVPLLQNEEFDQVYHALQALADLEAKEAIPDIVKVLDREGQIRGEAAVALARLKAKETIPKILPHLDDPDGNAQMRIAGALASLGAKEAIPGLVKMTKGDNFVLRQSGLRALVKLAGKEAIPHLRPLLTDPNRRVAYDALEAALHLQARELLPDLLAMIESAPSEDVVAAVARLGGRDQVPLMLKLGGHEQAGVRASALRGLGRLGAAEHRAKLDARLKDSDPEVRAAAAEALGRLGGRESIPGIEALLSDRIDQTALTAAKALCLLGSKKGAPLLLENPEELVHLNALRSPEEWKRLEADSRNGYRDGTDQELIEKMAAQAKLMVEWPKDLSEDIRAGLAVQRSALGWTWDEALSIREVLRVLLPEETDFILESGRLRIVTREAAQSFWRAWLR